MTDATVTEKEEVEKELDHTLLIDPMMAYYNATMAIINANMNDPIELNKIKIRLSLDANNLSALYTRCNNIYDYIVAIKSRREDLEKFQGEIVNALVKAKSE